MKFCPATGQSRCLSSPVRSVPNSSLALLSDDPGHESFVGKQVAAVLPKSNSRLDSDRGCSVASSRAQLTQVRLPLERQLSIATDVPVRHLAER